MRFYNHAKWPPFIALLLFLVPFGILGQSGERPNVIIINADDIGYGDLGAYGATLVKTPQIDRLAKEGRRFTDFHSASAVCSPSRYALITGRYPSRRDFWNPISLRTPLMVAPDRTTIADVMKRAGYRTGIVGKWHLGFGNESPIDWNKELRPGPLELGFDSYFGVPILNSHPPFVYVEDHKVVGLTPEDPMVYGKKAETRWFPEKMGLDAIGGGRAAHALYDDRMVGTVLKDKAVEFIRKHKDTPFFLYYATTNIHHPFTPAPRFIGTSKAGRYGDFIHELDWIVGEIVRTLEEEGLTENTMLIFTSDNGGMLNQGGQDAYSQGHHQNDGLLGFKFDAWEGGHRVPMIVRWPGRVPAGSVSNELLSNADFLATMAALVDLGLKEDEGPDSYNMLPAFTGTPKKPIRDQLVISPNKKDNLAIRKGKWMYISGQGGGGFSATKAGEHAFGGPAAFPFTGQRNSDIENGKLREGAPKAQLYNLEADIKESENLYDQNPRVARKMKELLEKTLAPD
ncbi:arylsulfatase [Arenibacter sp. ARW7G5Y1]|uniref:sulfatase family protein n=1 Tax=Arenibacter sp. ARW7G5Y1 TaxID=2135619 RepID=UPI000D76C0C4|nr:arylsulfatase [Arenibacter sp. ARW7G5Y1]PXX25492.1 arylsulfatase A-like enzyme [Arenibacter sp. ARW7G5Y1]